MEFRGARPAQHQLYLFLPMHPPPISCPSLACVPTHLFYQACVCLSQILYFCRHAFSLNFYRLIYFSSSTCSYQCIHHPSAAQVPALSGSIPALCLPNPLSYLFTYQAHNSLSRSTCSSQCIAMHPPMSCAHLPALHLPKCLNSTPLHSTIKLTFLFTYRLGKPSSQQLNKAIDTRGSVCG